MINLMICFARSGGTLLNRCLGSLPDVIIMSEVNPLGGGWGAEKEKSPTTIKKQAEQWYGISLKNNDFKNSAIELNKICCEQNKHLIIRDWSFVNFTPIEKNNLNPPNEILALKELEDRSVTFAFIRNSIDVWISRGTPPIEEFYEQYSKYIDELIKNNIKLFKYEDFCENPDTELKKICTYLNIPYSDAYKHYNDFTNVSGDIQNFEKSRGIKYRKIVPLKRKSIPNKSIVEINKCNKMIEINKSLGYGTSYYTSMQMRLRVLLVNVLLPVKRFIYLLKN